MDVIIATGKKEIDLMIKEVAGGTLSPVAYREGVLLQYQKSGAGLAFLSPLLSGNMPFEQLLYELRKQGVRIVVLVGHTSPKEIREKWLPLSVYDLILDPVTEEKIRLAMEYPATLGMAEEKIALLEKGQTEEPEEKGWSKWFRKKEHQKVKNPKESRVDKPIEFKEDTRPSALQWLFGGKQDRANESGLERSRETEVAQNKTEPENKPAPDKQPEPEKKRKPILDLKRNPINEPKQDVSEQSALVDDTQTIPDWVSVKQEPIFFNQKSAKQHEPVKQKSHDRKEPDLKKEVGYETNPYREWHTVLGFDDQKQPEPKGYTILVTSPSATGKTYVALNLAATLSKQGALTKLVSFRDETSLWTYLDMPVGKHGQVQGYPNLSIETFEKMDNEGHYRVIDLPFDRWNMVMHWENVLVVYVEDMDIHHSKICEKHRDTWQGKRLLRVLNRFVPNVLESGQEQRLRINADLVLSDLPVHLVAMRYGRPVIHLDQTAAREFEFAAKTILSAMPRKMDNIHSIG